MEQSRRDLEVDRPMRPDVLRCGAQTAVKSDEADEQGDTAEVIQARGIVGTVTASVTTNQRTDGCMSGFMSAGRTVGWRWMNKRATGALRRQSEPLSSPIQRER